MENKKLLSTVTCIIMSLCLFTSVFAAELHTDVLNNDVHQQSDIVVFNEDDFPGMIITYTENGIPIVDDPNAEYNPLLRAVTAYVISPYGYFYTDISLEDKYLLFSIPRGNAVTVLETYYTRGVARIEYAGFTGYIRLSNLNF